MTRSTVIGWWGWGGVEKDEDGYKEWWMVHIREWVWVSNILTFGTCVMSFHYKSSFLNRSRFLEWVSKQVSEWAIVKLIQWTWKQLCERGEKNYERSLSVLLTIFPARQWFLLSITPKTRTHSHTCKHTQTPTPTHTAPHPHCAELAVRKTRILIISLRHHITLYNNVFACTWLKHAPNGLLSIVYSSREFPTTVKTQNILTRSESVSTNIGNLIATTNYNTYSKRKCRKQTVPIAAWCLTL
jgi:hypothetical protein